MSIEHLTDTPAGSDSFLTENQLLEWLKISRKTCYNWVQSGKLPCVKVNRIKRYHRGSVEQALLRMQRNAPAGVGA